LEATVANQNVTGGENDSRFNSGNEFYHSFQNPLSSRLIFKNIKNAMQEECHFAVVIMDVKLWLSHEGNMWT
jgi:hypothetical protein